MFFFNKKKEFLKRKLKNSVFAIIRIKNFMILNVDWNLRYVLLFFLSSFNYCNCLEENNLVWFTKHECYHLMDFEF